MERKNLVFLIFIIILVGFSYWIFARDAAQLVANKNGSKRVDDFILHIDVERMDEGIQVYRSIQYVGKDPVEIQHQTPLIAISFDRKNFDYTGSPVTKVLDEGESYHPQDAMAFKSPEKGTYNVYVEAKFRVNGEKMIINHTVELEFE